MPGQDRTGPMGQGPMTGRAMGLCTGGSNSRFGRRNCRRFRSGFSPRQVSLSKEEEKKILEAELKEIELEKEEISKRLKDIK